MCLGTDRKTVCHMAAMARFDDHFRKSAGRSFAGGQRTLLRCSEGFKGSIHWGFILCLPQSTSDVAAVDARVGLRIVNHDHHSFPGFVGSAYRNRAYLLS